MFGKFAIKSVLILAIAVLLSTLAVGSLVTAKDNSLPESVLNGPTGRALEQTVPIPDGPGFISVSSYAFRAGAETADPSYLNGFMFVGDAGAAGNETFFAPVYLPHGASITKLLFFYSDLEVDFDLTFALDKIELSGMWPIEVAGATSSGTTDQGLAIATVTEPVVNNQLNAYVLRVVIPAGFHSDMGLFNVRIDYSYPTFLPTVQK